MPSYALIATPIDRSQPGSWRSIQQMLRLSKKLKKDSFDPDAFDQFMLFIEAHLRVPEGAEYTLAEALDYAAFDDMMALSTAVMGEQSVGEVSAAS